ARLEFPAEWVRWLGPTEASEQVGFSVEYGGVLLSDGQLVQPEPLIKALLGQQGIHCVAGKARAIDRINGQWVALDAHGSVMACARTAVLANGMGVKPLLASVGFLHGF